MASNATRVFDPNGWALIEVPFQMNDASSRLRITFHNPKASGALLLDEILIRPEGVDVYMRKPGMVFKNNRWYATAASGVK
jgi:hypothetical protein